MSSLEALLEDVLKNVPPGENQYLFLRDYLKELLLPLQPESFKIHLLVCSSILMLNLVLVIASFLVRVARRLPLAPFKVVKTPRGTMLSPQNLVTFAASMGAWLVLVQAFIWVTIAITVDDKHLPNGIVLLKTIGWLPLWWCAIFESWSTSCLDSSNKNRSLVAFYRSPLFINTFFPGILILGSVSMGVLFHLASVQFDAAYGDFLVIEAALEDNATTSTVISFTSLARLLPYAESMISGLDLFVSRFKDGWLCFCIAIVTPLLVYVPTAISHLSLLASQIRTIQRHNRRHSVDLSGPYSGPSTATGDSSAVQSSGHAIQVLGPRRSASATTKTLAGAYYRLALTSGIIFVLTLYYTGLTAFIAARPRWILNTVRGVQVQALAGLYPVTVPNTLICIFVVIRSLQSAPPRPHGSMSRSRSQDVLGSHSEGGGQAATRQQMGLRVAIPHEVIHIKTTSSPSSTLSYGSPLPFSASGGSLNEKWLSTSPTTQVQVPVLPHTLMSSSPQSSPVESPVSAKRTRLPRVALPAAPYRFSRSPSQSPEREKR